MIKKYIKPETIVFTINLSKSLLLTVSGGDEVHPDNFNSGTGEDSGLDDGEYSRSENSNGGNIWDNAW